MSLNITSIGTPDLCARDVVCDVGPTKGEEVEGGLALYITFNFRIPEPLSGTIPGFVFSKGRRNLLGHKLIF